MSRWPLSRTRARCIWGVDAEGLAWEQDGAPQLASHDKALDCALRAIETGTELHAIAGNDLAVHWLQQPPVATRSLAELKLVAAARCTHLYGGIPADWWIAGDWCVRRPFVCAALPRSVTQPLEAACSARGARLRWHTAWNVITTARAATIPDFGWSALRTPAQVMLWHCNTGHVDALSAFAVAPESNAAEIEAAVQVRMQLEDARDGVIAPGGLHWAEALIAEHEALAALSMGRLLLRGTT